MCGQCTNATIWSKKGSMTGWLVHHNLKSIRRSPDFHRKAATNIFFGLMASIIALELLLAGFFLHRILSEDVSPGKDPVEVFNSVLIYYAVFDLLVRLIFQKRRSVVARKYVLLRVSRSSIAHFVLLKTLLTLFNIWPLLIVLPFFFNGVVPIHSGLGSFAWFLSILGLILSNTYFANYVKLRFFTNPIRTLIAVSAVAGLALLEVLNLVSLSAASTTFFGAFLQFPLLACLPLLAGGALYWINHRFLVRNLYQEDTLAIASARKFREQFIFLRGFGEIGSLISLDLKLMLRNKRARISLWMPGLFVFYGLMFYPQQRYTSGDAVMDFFLMFVGTFITGFYIMSYGLTTFCYESKHFGLILTKRVDMLTYLKAKYYFMLMFTFPLYLLSLGYVYFGNRIFVVNSVMFLFNIGVTSFFILFLSTYNRMKFDLDAGLMSLQGKGSNQLVAVFLLMLLLLILYLPLRLLAGTDVALGTMGLLGIGGFFFHNRLLGILVKQFFRKKYVMAEGFRQT